MVSERTNARSGDRVDQPRASDRPLSEVYDAALLDLDGVIYLGGGPIPGAADALAEAAGHGMKRAYVTNNASNSLSVIDTTSNTVTATIPVGAAPAGVAITPDGSHVYTANSYSDSVTVTDTG